MNTPFSEEIPKNFGMDVTGVIPRAYAVDAAAIYTGLSASNLNKRRCDGTGPRFVRLAPNRVAYLKEDLDQWLDSLPKCSTTAETLRTPAAA